MVETNEIEVSATNKMVSSIERPVTTPLTMVFVAERTVFGSLQLRWLRLKAMMLFYSTPRRIWNLITERSNPHFKTLYLAPMDRVVQQLWR